jgi:hypothetical protein
LADLRFQENDYIYSDTNADGNLTGGAGNDIYIPEPINNGVFW